MVDGVGLKGREMRYQAVGLILVAGLVTSCSGAGAPMGSASVVETDTPSAQESHRSVAPSPTAATSREVSVSCDDIVEESTPPQGTSGAESASTMSITDLLSRDPRFAQFCTLAEQTVSEGLGLSWLEIWDWPANRMGDNQDGVTVFAPTDDAFAALDPALLTVLEDRTVDNLLLYSLLGHHYVHRLYPSTEFEVGPQRTWSGSGTVELSLDPLTFGGCGVVETDIRVANGYVHAIDCAVVPDELADAVAPSGRTD